MGVGSGRCEEVGCLSVGGRVVREWVRCVGSSVAGDCGVGVVGTSSCIQSVVADVGPGGVWVMFVVCVEAGMCVDIGG